MILNDFIWRLSVIKFLIFFFFVPLLQGQTIIKLCTTQIRLIHRLQLLCTRPRARVCWAVFCQLFQRYQIQIRTIYFDIRNFFEQTWLTRKICICNELMLREWTPTVEITWDLFLNLLYVLDIDEKKKKTKNYCWNLIMRFGN